MEHDIYSFINSSDIGEHCCKLGHKFSPAEAAYLIWRSERRNVYERHEAWNELIETTPDMTMQNNMSLHKLIQQYIELENEFIRHFCNNEAPYYYTVMTDNAAGAESFPECRICNTIEECFDRIKQKQKQTKILSFFIRKSPENGNECCEIRFNHALQPIRPVSGLTQNPLFKIFCRMCPVVPIPFKQGDVLQYFNCNKNYTNRFGYTRTALVFDKVGYFNIKEHYQDVDYSAYYNAALYAVSEDSDEITYIQIPMARESTDDNVALLGFENNYLDLEYYQGEPEGDERILTGISNYLKGKINISYLMNTYRVMTAENNFKKMMYPFGGMYGIDEPLKLGGWTSQEVERWKKEENLFWEDLCNE